MIAIVIDANVYISALVFGGVPRKVIQLSQREGWQVCISRSIMDEVAETLAEKFDWTKAELDFALPPLWQRCRQVEYAIRLNVCVDDDDNRVLECAKASGAKLVSTGDNQLLRLKHLEDTVIITPRAFLTLLQEERLQGRHRLDYFLISASRPLSATAISRAAVLVSAATWCYWVKARGTGDDSVMWVSRKVQ